MNHRTTRLLLLLLLVCAASASIAYARLARQRDLAQHARDDLLRCRELLSQLSNTSTASVPSPTAPDLGDLNRRIRAASTSAGLPDNLLPNIESRQPMPLENSDLHQMAIFLGFESLTLEQLVTFLHRMTAADRSCTVDMIELSIPESDAKPDDSKWRADVKLSYLIQSSRTARSRTPARPTDEEPR